MPASRTPASMSARMRRGSSLRGVSGGGAERGGAGGEGPGGHAERPGGGRGAEDVLEVGRTHERAAETERGAREVEDALGAPEARRHLARADGAAGAPPERHATGADSRGQAGT